MGGLNWHFTVKSLFFGHSYTYRYFDCHEGTVGYAVVFEIRLEKKNNNDAAEK